MPFRTTLLVNDQFYHVYNRGVEKRVIFSSRRDYSRFLKAMQYYQVQGPKPKFSNYIKKKAFELDTKKRIVEIIAYCLMPNHFHALIKQIQDNGVSEFMGKISNSYTKYYNTKYNRVGPLLQGQFKAVFIEDDNQLVHVSRYIHLNPLVSYLVKDLKTYEFSSYNEYAQGSQLFCSKDIILNFFKSSRDYQQFVLDQTDYGLQLERIKHKLIDEL